MRARLDLSGDFYPARTASMSAAVRTIQHRRVFYELYADDEAFRAHEAAPEA